MNDAFGEAALIRKWFICERGHRWFDAARRFVPDAMPDPLIADFQAISTAQQVADQMSDQPAAVLWEIHGQSFLQNWDQIVRVAQQRPHWIQLVAAEGLQIHHRLALAESPIALIIERPEQLPMTASLIRGHFAGDA